MEFGKVQRISLPELLVASYEVVSESPEQTAIDFMEHWLQTRGLNARENGVRGFGFDCHKGRDIPAGCRIYRVYYAVPESVEGDSEVQIKTFRGGDFAKLIVTDPFSGDFPLAWGVLLQWTFENNVENGLGCASPDDCYSLFSNEDTPCLEELYWDNGTAYMVLYLPVKQ